MPRSSAAALVRCRHCGALRSALRAKRGLCRRCHGSEQGCIDPGVRHLYPHTGRCHVGLGTEDQHRRDRPGAVPDPEPCPTLAPGPGKIDELARRYAQRRALFHAAEPALPLRAFALPFGVRRPVLWRALAAACPDVIRLLKELVPSALPATTRRARD